MKGLPLPVRRCRAAGVREKRRRKLSPTSATSIQLWLEVAEEDARSEAGREAGTLAEVTV